jgi:acetyl-CoA/propionyl-CoA carboxylase carboxyl transferase subunit
MELELAAEHDRISGGINTAVEIGAVDEVIEPTRTRTALVQALASAPHRRGSHGNIPL